LVNSTELKSRPDNIFGLKKRVCPGTRGHIVALMLAHICL